MPGQTLRWWSYGIHYDLEADSRRCRLQRFANSAGSVKTERIGWMIETVMY